MHGPGSMPVRRWTWSAPGWATWPPPTPPSSPAATQAECLRELEQDDAVADRGAGRGSWPRSPPGRATPADADYSAVSWLIHRTGITRGAAVGHTAWAKRAATHPRVLAALAAGQVSGVGRAADLPVDRQAAGGVPGRGRRAAAGRRGGRAGAGGPGGAVRGDVRAGPRRTCPIEDPGRDFADREVKLATTFGGAGVLHGDLTAGVRRGGRRAVLDALSAPAGKEDDRTQEQRYHDALAEAMRRLAAGGLLPERAGQPVKAWAHISLADLLLLDGDSALQEQWTAQVRARWAARRALAVRDRRDGGAWLDGDAAEAIACDAAMAPIVTGDVNVDALEDLVRLCVELDAPPAGRRPRDAAWAALEQAVIGKAVDLLSGPGGLASASCAAGSSGPGWAGRACRWTSGTPRRSRPGSATR